MSHYRDGHSIEKPRVVKSILVDSSVDVTGAVTSAIAMSDALKNDIALEWVVSKNANERLVSKIKNHGFNYFKLNILELKREPLSIVYYVPNLLISGLRLRLLLTSNRANLLLINDYYNLMGFIVRMLGWRGKIITFVRLIPSKQHRFLNIVWQWFARVSSDFIICPSNAVYSEFPNKNKVLLIPEPITSAFFFDNKHRVSIRAKEPIKFLYLANYINGKGQLDAIEAFAIALSRLPKIELTFYGSDMGLLKNKKYKGSLEKRIRQLALSHKVFLKEQIDDVSKLMVNVDIFLNFSEAESFSRVCLEASQAGLPIVCTRCGGPNEIVIDGVTGILVAVGDVTSMAQGMIELATDQSLRYQMGQAGKKFVSEKFSQSNFRNKIIELIR